MEKRLKTTNADDKSVDNTEEDDCIDIKKGELFKHVKDSKKSDTETLDAATNVCILLLLLLSVSVKC